MTHALIALALAAAQEAGPRSPADLVPREIGAYVEVRSLIGVPGALKAWVDRFAAEGKALDALARIDKLAEAALAPLPGEARVRLKLRMLAVRSVGIGLPEFFGFDGVPRALLALEMANEAIAAEIVTKDLPPLAPTRFRVGEAVVLRLDLTDPVFVSARGKFVIVSTDLKEVAAALGRAPDSSVSTHPAMAEFGAEAPVGPHLRGFFDIARMMSESSTNDSRRERRDFDLFDAATGISRIRWILVRADIREGLVRTHLETKLEGPVPVLELFRGSGGEPRAWKYVPANAFAAVSIRAEEMKAVVGRIRGFVKRVEAVNVEAGDPAQDYWQEFESNLAEEIGSVDDVVAALAPEALLFVAPRPGAAALAGEFPAVAFVLRVKDRERAADLFEHLRGSLGIALLEKEHGDVTIYHNEGGFLPSAMALTDDAFIFGLGAASVEVALDTHKEGKGFLAHLPKLPGAAELMAGAFQTAAIGMGPLADLASELAGMAPVPGVALEKGLLAPHASDVTAVRVTAKGLEIDSVGSGGSAVAGLLLPFSLWATVRWNGKPPEVVFDGAEPRAETPATSAAEAYPLPADPKEADALIAHHVARLRSEESTDRSESYAILERIGRRAVPAFAEAIRTETDVEAKLRLKTLIEGAGAYETLPEVLDVMLADLRGKLAKPEVPILHWSLGEVEDQDSPEPDVWHLRLKSEAALRSPEGVKRVARLFAESADGQVRRNAAALLALYDSSAVEADLPALLGSAADPQTLLFLTMATGWGRSEASVRTVVQGIGSDSARTMRSSFLAAERSESPAVVDALVEACGSDHPERRFNAAFTLRRLSKGALGFSPFLPAAERAPELAALRARWTSVRGTLKLRRTTPGGL